MKPTATTLQQRMGFIDGELSTPKHDELVFWLMKQKIAVAKCIMHDRYRLYREKNRQVSYNFVREAAPHLAEESIRDFLDSQPEPELLTATLALEVPVKSGSFTIGFLDGLLVVKAESFEVKRTSNQICWSRVPFFFREVAIEIKPEIRSFGETLRQLNHYRQYIGSDSLLLLISPDTRFREQFEDQDVLFISPLEMDVL